MKCISCKKEVIALYSGICKTCKDECVDTIRTKRKNGTHPRYAYQKKRRAMLKKNPTYIEDNAEAMQRFRDKKKRMELILK